MGSVLSTYAKSSDLTGLAKSTDLTGLAKSTDVTDLAKASDLKYAKISDLTGYAKSINVAPYQKNAAGDNLLTTSSGKAILRYNDSGVNIDDGMLVVKGTNVMDNLVTLKNSIDANNATTTTSLNNLSNNLTLRSAFLANDPSGLVYGAANTNKNTKWIQHVPNDDRGIITFAPYKDTDWNWDNGVMFGSDGSINANKLQTNEISPKSTNGVKIDKIRSRGFVGPFRLRSYNNGNKCWDTGQNGGLGLWDCIDNNKYQNFWYSPVTGQLYNEQSDKCVDTGNAENWGWVTCSNSPNQQLWRKEHIIQWKNGDCLDIGNSKHHAGCDGNNNNQVINFEYVGN